MYSRLFIFSFFIAVFSFSCTGSGDGNETDEDTLPIITKVKPLQSKPGVVYPILLKKSQRTPYEDASLILGDTVFYCSYKGKIEWSDTIKRERHFIYDIRAEFMVDRLYISPLGGEKYFINWQETDHNGVRSYAAVVETGAAKPVWKQQFTAPNPGMSAIDSGSVYTTALGVVAKINLADGAIAWKYDSLYSTVTLSYQKFQPVIVREKEIIFIDYPVNGRRPKCDTLVVDAETGLRLK